jgi:hypothetical protein
MLKFVTHPRAALSFVGAVIPLVFWALSNELRGRFTFGKVRGVHPKLQAHAKFARTMFARQSRSVYRNMLAKQVRLADEQDLMVDELSMRTQKAVVMLVTCYHATAKGDDTTIAAANVLCMDLKRELVGGDKSAAYRRSVRKLADAVMDGKFEQLKDTPETPILRRYDA